MKSLKLRNITIVIFLLSSGLYTVSTSESATSTDRGTEVVPITIRDNNVLNSISTDFISKWSTFKTSLGSTNDKAIKLPLESTGSYNFQVDWGDGTSDSILEYNQSEVLHAYSVLGTYTIIISGTLIGWSFNDMGDHKKIVEISQWGNINLGNSSGYFDGCSNLELNATDAPDLTGTTTLASAFRYASSLGNIGSLATWDVSQVTDMSRLFYQATDFNMSLNSWDVSKVTDMSFLFSKTSDYNQPMDAWDVSSATNMESMFYQSPNFNQPLNSWNVKNVTSMYSLFHSASNFDQELNNWDVSNVLDMRNLFSHSVSFNRSINNWNISSVTNLAQLFYGASSFNQPLDKWDVSNVLFMERVFRGAIIFNQPLNTWNVSSVINMDSMFYEASSFNHPLDKWNVSSVTRMSSTFYLAIAFDQNISNWNVEKVQYMSQMFRFATLSPQNYSALLLGWSELNLKTNVYFHGGYSKYLNEAAAARQILIDTFSWSIIDGGITSLPEVSHPSDISYVVGTSGNTIVWTVGVSNPDVYNITMNGNIYTITQSWLNGTITQNIDGLPVGTYEFIFYLYDIAGEMNYDKVTVIVSEMPDVTKPDVSTPIDAEYTYGTAGILIIWSVGDVNPGTYNVTKNGTLYKNNQSWSNGSITLDIVGLVVGNHEFILYVYDLNGNSASDSVMVTISEVQTETTSTSTSSTTSPNSSDTSSTTSPISSDTSSTTSLTSPDTSSSTSTQPSATTSSSQKSESDSTPISILPVLFSLFFVVFSNFLLSRKKS